MAIKTSVSFFFSFMGFKARKRINNSSSHEAIGSKDSKLCEDLDGELCCVCLSNLEQGEDSGTQVLPCLHEFHRVCIDTWFSGRRKTCPVCRFLVEDEEKSQDKEHLTEELVTWFSSFHVAGF